MDLFPATKRPGPQLSPPCSARFAGEAGRAGPRLRREASVLKAIVASCLFHALLLGSIIFSFNVRTGTSRPFFVFLGSILQEQDFLISYHDHSLAAVEVPIYETAALLTDRPSPVVLVEKPSLPGRLQSPGKIFWKPALAREIKGKTPEEESSAYVPLRLSPSSPKLWDLRRDRGQ